jgi:spore germination protein D
MIKKFPILYMLLITFILSGCVQAETSESDLDYDQTKKMVVDILKTDDGKKAIQEVMTTDEMKQQLIMDQALVTDTIQTTLTSEKATDFWKKTYEDPKFAESMAQTMQKENETILKNLMNDPEYRAQMVEILKDPELEKEMQDLLKSAAYREHLKEIVTETIESPLYQTKIQELLLKAAEEKSSAAEKEAESA